MQIGITIPLQKFLKYKKPPYGKPMDLFFCWEVHVINYQGKSTLIAVNANNRFICIMSPMGQVDWMELPLRVEQAIEQGMQAEGYSKERIDAYFNLAGWSEITKTHGRKPVAGLNKAIDYLFLLPDEMDEMCMYQEKHCHTINRDTCSPAGFEIYGRPVDFFAEDMKRIGI